MKIIQSLVQNLSQIVSLTEKDIKLRLRYKASILFSFINPIISIILPIIIMGQFFQHNANFGPWTKDNYLVFLFMAYNITLLTGLTSIFAYQFRMEKFWKTLSALIIAPFNRFNLLFGIFFSYLLIISVPFVVFFTVCYFYFPVSFSTVLCIIVIYFLIALFLSGIGLILGIFTITNENISTTLGFFMFFVLWSSCISYPYQIFPPFIQSIINLNPFYYLFDVLRLVWIEDNIILSLKLHTFHFFILIFGSIILPFIGVYSFNKIYKKFGISGY